MKKITLGSKVVVSDPCYEIPTWCQEIINNVEPGEYECDVEISNEGEWGERISRLIITKNNSNHNWESYSKNIGVDSGQCGVFDFYTYRRNNYVPEMEIVERVNHKDWDYSTWEKVNEEGEKWYGKICEYTLCTEERHGGYDKGYVSSSGYGDGQYELFVTKNDNGEINGFKIVFIDNEYNDEEEEEYEYNEEENDEIER